MTKAIDFDLQKYDGEFKAAGIARMTKAAEAIRDAAKRKCKTGTVTRPERKHFVWKGKWGDGHLHESMPGSAIWTERTPGAMRETIRVVRKYDDLEKSGSVRVYAGNFKTWWAQQMEYGFGAWKGGPRPFLRPALHESVERIRAIIEGR